MIDLTPLDVRKKRGDFRRLMRGYDPQEVDVFLELVAERLEALVRENLQLKERASTLQVQVSSQLGREQAVQDALVTAQELRADIAAQSQREAELMLKEADTEARRMIAEAEAQVRSKLRGVERQVDSAQGGLQELERRRTRFLKEFRVLLERELDVVEVEEARTPLEDRTIDLDLGGSSGSGDGGGGVTLPRPAPVGGGPGSAREAPSETGADAGSDDVGDGPVGPALMTESEEEGPEPRATTAPQGAGREAVAEEVTAAAAPAGREGIEATDPATDGAPVPDGAEADASVPSDAKVDHPRSEETVAEGSFTDEIELPTFAVLDPPASPAEPERPYDALAASMEAEARAEAQSQVVEVTGSDADRLPEVPRLEEVLAEAGAELVDPGHESIAQAPPAEPIDPPRISRKRPDQTLLLYPDQDADR